MPLQQQPHEGGVGDVVAIVHAFQEGIGRDFLRANDDHRETWGRFKTRLAEEHLDIYAYGQLKASAQPLLMSLAERWAAEKGWQI